MHTGTLLEIMVLIAVVAGVAALLYRTLVLERKTVLKPAQVLLKRRY